MKKHNFTRKELDKAIHKSSKKTLKKIATQNAKNKYNYKKYQRRMKRVEAKTQKRLFLLDNKGIIIYLSILILFSIFIYLKSEQII